MSSRNRDSFTSSFLISMPFVSLCSSYLPVYAEVQKPHVYLQSSQVEVRNLYLGVPAKTTITLINGTLLPTQFHWGKVSEPTASGSSLQPSATEAHVEGGIVPQISSQNRDTQPPSHSLSLAHSVQESSSKEQRIWSSFFLPCL